MQGALYSKLELPENKILITHARTGTARFLGYEITVQHNRPPNRRWPPQGQRVISLRAPDVIKASAPLPEAGKTRAAIPSRSRRRSVDHQHVRVRVPGLVNYNGPS